MDIGPSIKEARLKKGGVSKNWQTRSMSHDKPSLNGVFLVSTLSIEFRKTDDKNA